VALAASLLVSYTRARAEGLGLTCRVGIAHNESQRWSSVMIRTMFGRPSLARAAGAARNVQRRARLANILIDIRVSI